MCHHHPQQTFFLSPCQPDLLILCGDGKAWESIYLLIPDGDGKLEMWCSCVISGEELNRSLSAMQQFFV
jgi:hypothetical protein